MKQVLKQYVFPFWQLLPVLLLAAATDWGGLPALLGRVPSRTGAAASAVCLGLLLLLWEGRCLRGLEKGSGGFVNLPYNLTAVWYRFACGSSLGLAGGIICFLSSCAVKLWELRRQKRGGPVNRFLTISLCAEGTMFLQTMFL